ncbi:hypothetical protein PsorP6_016231 [Peronosclerospora sorghi]|uniref:Uncharacterized protein n=1 Tax=Peronosclerospora sorghi TaxID=230839 RepID=A0ACC0VNA9_9STRA|nr:hypothetical protein PsorP6_016231 [Peronosclerospora sorghi]
MNGVLNDDAVSKHRRGCNCRKSGCAKLYCECFTAHVRCSERCQCTGCKNQDSNQDEMAQATHVSGQRSKKPLHSSVPELRASRAEPAPEPTNRTLTSPATRGTEAKATRGMATDSARPRCAYADGHCTTDCPCLRSLGVCSPRCPCNGCRGVPIQSERTKGCSCKKSSCLKLYCECFAAQHLCDHRCNCEGCKNQAETRTEREGAVAAILERNPLAFQPKVASGSSQHLRGCNCRKSGCMKNYCECHQAGVTCTSRCACHQCRNTETFVSASKMHVLAGVTAAKRNQCSSVHRPTQHKMLKQVSHGNSTHADAPEGLPTPTHSSSQRPKALELLSQSAPVAPVESTRRRNLSVDEVSSTTPHKRPLSYVDQPAGGSDVSPTLAKRKYRRQCMHKVPLMERIQNASAPTEDLPSVEETVATVYDARRTEGIGDPELTPLCRSLLHAAMVVDCADADKSAHVSVARQENRGMHSDPRRVDDSNDDRASLSPSAANLFCEEEYSEDAVEGANHFDEAASSVIDSSARCLRTDFHEHTNNRRPQTSKHLNLSAMQERAVLQEFSVWLRNMNANVWDPSRWPGGSDGP